MLHELLRPFLFPCNSRNVQIPPITYVDLSRPLRICRNEDAVGIIDDEGEASAKRKEVRVHIKCREMARDEVKTELETRGRVSYIV